MIRCYDTDRCCYRFTSEGALKKFLKEHAELYSMAASFVAAYSSSAYYCFFYRYSWTRQNRSNE